MITLKPGQALSLWQKASMAQVHDDDADLTTRQLAILLTIYLEPPPHTVRGYGGAVESNQTGDYPGAGHDGYHGTRCQTA